MMAAWRTGTPIMVLIRDTSSPTMYLLQFRKHSSFAGPLPALLPSHARQHIAQVVVPASIQSRPRCGQALGIDKIPLGMYVVLRQ
jgi:hypothetical protein